MADYKHGEMDITVQQQTFERFIKITTRAVVAITLLLIFLGLSNG